MSEKTSKQKRTEENKKACQDLVNQLQRMTEDCDKKCIAAKDQLIDNLKITADKYRTATGVMEALRVMRMVNDGKPNDIGSYVEFDQARELAANMVIEVSNLVKKAESLGYAELDELCKGAYEEDFISSGFSAIELCFELMRLDLCRNIGPAAEDMVSFINRVQEEIKATEDKLDELDEDWRTKYEPTNVGESK